MMKSSKIPSIAKVLRVAILVVAAVVAIPGLRHISLNVDILSQLPAHLREKEGISRLEKHFGSRQGLLLVLQEKNGSPVPEEWAEKVAGALVATPGLADSVSWRNSMEDPSALADLVAYTWLNANSVERRELMEKLVPERSKSVLDDAIEELTTGNLGENTMFVGYDPFGLSRLLRSSVGAFDSFGGQFASGDGTIRLISVQPPEGAFSGGYREQIAWIERVKKAAEKTAGELGSEAGELSISCTGEPAFVAEISASMEHDMRQSSISTALLVSVLFWVFFRRVRALFLLIGLLALVLLLTLSTGSLMTGALTAMGAGFVAIVIGLTIDYGAVLLESDSSKSSGLRNIVIPIFWAAFTTAVVFFSLRLSSFPGIVQFGTLVGVGVLFGAVIMVLFFAPEATRPVRGNPETGSGKLRAWLYHRFSFRIAWTITALLLVGCVVVFFSKGLPSFDPVFRPFQLKESEAVAAFDQVQEKMGGADGWEMYALWYPNDEPDEGRGLSRFLEDTRARLEKRKEAGVIADYSLPIHLVPQPDREASAGLFVSAFSKALPRLREEMEEAGFSEEPIEFLERCVRFWIESEENEVVKFRDEKGGAQNLIRQVVAEGDGEICLLASVKGKAGKEADSLFFGDEKRGLGPASWGPMAKALQAAALADLRKMTLPVLVILAFSLLFIFRSLRDSLLCVGSLLLGLVLLMGMLSQFGIQVNAFAACAIPILLGTGLDYSIHMIFAQRRAFAESQDIEKPKASEDLSGILRALRFCGLSSAIAFASLATSSSEGLANLGIVCGVGILINMLVATLLLPAWRRPLERGL